MDENNFFYARDDIIDAIDDITDHLEDTSDGLDIKDAVVAQLGRALDRLEELRKELGLPDKEYEADE